MLGIPASIGTTMGGSEKFILSIVFSLYYFHLEKSAVISVKSLDR